MVPGDIARVRPPPTRTVNSQARVRLLESKAGKMTSPVNVHVFCAPDTMLSQMSTPRNEDNVFGLQFERHAITQ